MKQIELLVNEQLPDELKGKFSDYSQKGINKIMAAVQQTHPERYAQVQSAIGDIGADQSFRLAQSIRLGDLEQTFDKKKFKEMLSRDIEIQRQSSKTKEEFKKKRMDVWLKYNDVLTDNTKQSKDPTNFLVQSILSGARGKIPQYKLMASGTGLFSDAEGNIIPIFGENSYADGVSPQEWFQATYGSRSSVVSTKVGTAKGGYVGKLFSQQQINEVITSNDCGTENGIMLSVDDPSMKYRCLQRKELDFDKDTLIGTGSLEVLRDKLKGKKILVRSQLTCGCKNGICAKCQGQRDGGVLPSIGDHFGETQAGATSEPQTQLALNAKHTGGQVSGKKSYSGLSWITQQVMMPSTYKDAAQIQPVDGTITDVVDQPQGGKYIHIGDEEIYVPSDLNVSVQKGETVFAGDKLSDGLLNPQEVTKYKGIGEGRIQWIDTMSRILDDTGIPQNRRNLEVIQRPQINHVDLEDDFGDYLPGDTVYYNQISHAAQEQLPSADVDIGSSKGKYLQREYLHYTVGTRITPEVIKNIKESGTVKVKAMDTPPPFVASAESLRNQTKAGDDWIQKQYTSGLKDNLVNDQLRHSTSNIQENHSFVPRLAVGTDFQKNITRTGKF